MQISTHAHAPALLRAGVLEQLVRQQAFGHQVPEQTHVDLHGVAVAAACIAGITVSEQKFCCSCFV